MGLFTSKNWKEIGMKLINEHLGKKQVYEAYLKTNPLVAEEYLRFVAKNPYAVYISWDEKKNRFIM